MNTEIKDSSLLRTDDGSLIRELNQGDKEAYTRLYEKYVGRIYRFLYHLLKDAEVAEDATQFCFMQVWLNRENISCEKNLSSYLFVIARNAAYKEFRKQLVADIYIDKTLKKDDNFEKADDGMVDFKLIHREIQRCVEALPEVRRKIYLMSRAEGLKSKEIAERLDITVSTVDVQLSRARTQIRTEISKLL